jgi:heat shock protein HtpX
LAGALQKIAVHSGQLRAANRATAHLYIANPLRKVRSASGLFDTHPPIQLRIDLLLAMAHGEAAAHVVASEGDGQTPA